MRSDFQSALRLVRSKPGFALAVILTIGLGVGAVTAVLTLADPILFRALPFPRADRLFMLKAVDARLHLPDAVRAEAGHHGFSAVGDFNGPIDIGRIGLATDTSISYSVSRGYLGALGVQPVVGRTFRDDEYTTDHRAGVALIMFGLWQSAFGGRADIVGQRVTFSGARGRTYEVIGVLPKAFFFPDAVNEQPALLIPGALDPARTQANVVTYPLVRLRDGVSPGAAIAEMQAIVTNVEREFPAYERDRRVTLVPLRESLFGRVQTPLLMLLAATLSVLLLASVNLSHLVMAWLRARARDTAIRLAIGASRWRIVRQLLIEAFVLFACGGIAALGMAAGLSRLMMAYMPPLLHTYHLVPAMLDWRVAGFSLGLTAAAAIVSALFPAIRASREDLRTTLQGSSAADGRRGVLRSGSVLVFAQAALGIALLVTGLLIVRSFAALVATPLGFAPEHVRTIGLEFPSGVAEDPAAVPPLQRRVYDALLPRMPIALVDGIPGMHLSTAVSRPDLELQRPPVLAWPVSGTFFDVFGLRLVRGRLFTDAEAFSDAPVAVIDQRAADLLWPGADPIGRSIKELRGPVRMVVGVVQTIRSDLLGQRFQRGGAFLPFSRSRFYIIAYRAERSDPTIAELTSIVGQVVPGTRATSQPLELFERQLGQPRFLALLLGVLAVLAILLTVVGVFGVVNHEVARRTKEIGIRLALGAEPPRIRRLVLAGALAPALLGGILGLSVSLWLTETLRSLLYGLSPHDPVVYLTTLIVMLMTVAVGTLMPARRATRVDPMVALRAE
jgi:putative ABC transport system permease protein